MCDDDTEADNAKYLQAPLLNRRELGIGAGAVVATVVTGCAPTPDSPATSVPSANREPTPTVAHDEKDSAPTAQGRRVTIKTPDGEAEAFFVAPGEGKHPGVIVWPDIAGLRESFETMATRLAEQGYAVLAVNQYYRSSKLPVLESFDEWRTPEGKAKIKPMLASFTPEAIAKDATAFAAWLDTRDAVDPGRKLGTTGYCMGGPFTFRTAAAVPDRVRVAASFHGGGLATEAPDSPHTLLPNMKGAVLVCVAQSDDDRDPQTKVTLQKAADATELAAEIEVYPAQHGWCVLDSPVYDETQAGRAWTRMLATFEAHL